MSDADTFSALRALLSRRRGDAIVTTDSDDHYALARLDVRGKPAFLASVQAKKSYIAFHLFPVYPDPGLLDDLSAKLRKRMQGKSCFNFKATDDVLFAELDILVARTLAN